MIQYEYFNTELANKYLKRDTFAFDIETDTNNYHWRTGERGLSYCADITHISVYSPELPVLLLKAVPRELNYLAESLNLDTGEVEQFPVTRLKWEFPDDEKAFIFNMFSRSVYTAIAHNLVFDARQIFGKFNIPVNSGCILWDTQAIHLTAGWDTPEADILKESGEELDEGDGEEKTEGYSLENLASQFFEEDIRSFWRGFKNNRKWLSRFYTDAAFSTKRGVTQDDIDLYACIDAVAAYKLYEWQMAQPRFEMKHDEEQKISFDGLDHLIGIDLAYTKLCVEMSVRGMKLNTEYVKQERDKYIEQWLTSLEKLGVGRHNGDLVRKIKWKSEYIFSRIQEPTDQTIIETYRLKTNKGAWSFNKVAIAYYLEQYPQLLDYRRHVDLETKIKRIDEFLRHAEYDGRVHSIVSRLAVTGRNTSSAPNMQNLSLAYKPENYYEGVPELDCGYFIADDGYVLVSLDCSNAENRAAAMYARDDDFSYAICQEDFHTQMARIYFPDVYSNPELSKEVVKSWRKIGKNVTFASAYGAGLKKLSLMTKLPQDKLSVILENRDRKFWRTARAKENAAAFANAHGYTILWTGRRVRMRKRNGQYKGYTAWNSLAQGAVGELIVRGMLAVNEYLKDEGHYSCVVGQVHDEIIIALKPEEYKDVMLSIISLLSNVVPDLLNSRTTPKTRWLFDLCNRTNAKKWGFVPGEQYPLPLNEYANLWGFHIYPEGINEAPTWINEYGYGEQALSKELGLELEDTSTHEKSVSISRDAFSWLELSLAIKNTLDLLGIVHYNGRMFDFPEAIEIQRALYHRGVDSDYEKYVQAFDELASVVAKYKQWRDG